MKPIGRMTSTIIKRSPLEEAELELKRLDITIASLEKRRVEIIDKIYHLKKSKEAPDGR
jgi:chorismate mutase